MYLAHCKIVVRLVRVHMNTFEQLGTSIGIENESLFKTDYKQDIL